MTPRQNRTIRQTLLWVNGVCKHNNADNECCPDFSCCQPTLFETNPEKRRAYLVALRHRYDRPQLKRKERA